MHRSGSSVEHLARVVGGTLIGSPTREVVDVTHDSRQVGPGVLFVAVRGFTTDGHDYVRSAAEREAAGVCVEGRAYDVDTPQIVVPDTRRALGPLAAEVHGRPADHIPVLGVTGTNGKTTVVHMLTSIARSAGLITGSIGTIGVTIGDRLLSGERTTPEASDVQRLLATMIDEGVEAVAMEVSSHAIELGRVDAIRFRVAGFTNLGRDHLDFHGDMTNYIAAKRALFETERCDHAVVWIDDDVGRSIVNDLRVPATTVALSAPADVSGHLVDANIDGSVVDMSLEGRIARVRVPLAGRFNVENALIAAAMAVRAGLPSEAIVAGLGELGTVAGRFEVISRRVPSVVVDFAHTPDGIRAVIDAARGLSTGRVIVVFGAGGDRDRGKRAEMGAAACLADLAIVTSDNPRSEDPERIIDEVMAGMVPSRVLRISDRRSAIEEAIVAASGEDLILILGKGHETGQTIAGVTYPFDDRQIARDILRSVAGGAVR